MLVGPVTANQEVTGSIPSLIEGWLSYTTSTSATSFRHTVRTQAQK